MLASVRMGTSWADAGLVAVSAVGMLAAVIAAVRITGLRSFAKMSSFDFAVTVATGSILGSVALTGGSLLDGVVAVGTLFAFQATIALGRTRWGLGRLVDNTPIVLMAGAHVFDDNLRRTRVSERDLWAKLRSSGVASRDDLLYVVLETTGEMSVVADGSFDRQLLDGVVDADRAAALLTPSG